ncbi:MAG: SusC/RagA family TonB-linked outer membrane protein, partial [Bacteroidaceae bacterium]|nr:SusC/RagA family TonB-linked outer membrane protein [Bacteroidaceae bacterium]
LWQALANDGDDPNTNKLGYKYDWGYNNGVPTLYGQTINEFLDPNNRTMPSSDTDWFKEITRTGLIHQYNASLSRGGETGSSFFSLGYYGNQGIVKNTDFSRISGRMNNEFKFLKDIITVGEHFTFSRTNETVMPGDVLNNALNMNPLVPVYSANGGWGGQVGSLPDLFNPVRTLEYNKNNGYGLWRTFGDAYLNVNPLKGLNIKTTFGIDYLSKDEKSYKLPYVEGIKHSDDNGVTMRREQTMRWMWNAVATYNKEIGKNHIDLMAGIELNHSNYEWHSSYKEDFAHYTTDYMWPSAGSGESKAEGGSDGFALVSYFGKANYTYDNKYLASVTVRYDGSSRFGKNNRYATFPSFSLGWRLSEEKFMEGTKSWLDDLKPRFSWGQTGNSEISNIARYTIYKFDTGDGGLWSGGGYGTGYDIQGTNGGAGTLPSGFKREQIGNEDIKWETTTQTNLGLDFTMFGSRLYGSFEYYWKNTKDILIFMAGSAAQGEGNYQWINAGEMDNRGLELTLGWRSTTKFGLTYNITGNIGQYTNEITSAPLTNATNGSLGGDGLNIIGHPMGARGGYVCDGIFKSQEEVDNHAKQEGAAVGRLRYRDLDGNGIINDADKDWICSPVPDFTYGLNIYLEYKGFDFTAFMQGVAGLDIVNDVKRRTDFFGIENMPYLNKGDRLMGAWSLANPDSDIPAVSLNNLNREDRLSTYYVENGSYLKLRNLQIGYSFQSKILKKINMTRLRMYLSAQNVLTIKGGSFTGVDPEIPNMSYPIPM